MPDMKMRGHGLFIEFSRTPGERKRVEKDAQVEQVMRENEELKRRLERLEALFSSEELNTSENN